MKKNRNDGRCPCCWETYQLEVRPRPITIKSWVENGKKVTYYTYFCSCGCGWKRTEVEDTE